MSENMNEALFDFAVEYALGDCLKDEIAQIDKAPKTIPISEQFKKFFKKLLAKRKRIRFLHTMPLYTKRLLITVFTLITILSCLLIAQQPVYAAVKNVFYEWEKDFLNFRTTDSSTNDSNAAICYGLKANYLPLNYVLAEASIQPQTFSISTYMNFDDADCTSTAITIVFGNTANDINGGFDNEHGTLTPLDIDGVTDIQFIKSNSPEYLNHISWVKDGWFFWMDTPYSVAQEEIIKIIQNIDLIF